MAGEGFALVWLWGCTAVTATAGMVAAISKFWKWAHQKSDSNSTRLDEIDVRLEAGELKMNKLEFRQKSLEDEQRLQLKALMTIMNQLLDGNDKAKMTEVRDEINKYLIDK